VLRMRFRHLALILGCLGTPTVAQSLSDLFATSERLPPFTPFHTAVYTTVLVPKDRLPSQVIITTTAIVTLFIPREGSTVTGTAISRFSAAVASPPSTWAETSQLVWTVAGINNVNGLPPPPQNTNMEFPLITGVYTDYSHYTTTMLGAWTRLHFDYRSTLRETIVEEINAVYPATIHRTGYSVLQITAVGGSIGYPDTTFTNSVTTEMARATTLVQVPY